MPQNFFVFIETMPARARVVGRAILELRNPHVLDVSSISGTWDLLVRVQVADGLAVDEEVLEPLAGVADIVRTETVIAFRVFDPNDVWFDEG